MSEQKQLPEIVINKDMAPAIYVEGGLKKFVEQIKESVNEVPDLSTKKGRDRIASLSAQVSRSKTAVEKPGRDYLRHLKDLPRVVEAELREFVRECDSIRDEVRRPLTEWEAEQERVKAEEEARIAAEKLAQQVAADHEIALLMDREIDRERAEAAAEADRQRIAHEEEIRRQAAEQARIEAENKAREEKEAAARREFELKMKAEQAERDRIAAEQRAEFEKREAAELAERQRIESEQRAEREKQAAVEAERKRAQDAENARLAAEREKIAEDERRAADKKHRDGVFLDLRDDLIEHAGLNEVQAKQVIIALLNGKIRNQKINF